MRQKTSSGTVWENEVGYSRAIRVGNIIEVAGTMVEVSRLIHPDLKVEIEVSAILLSE